MRDTKTERSASFRIVTLEREYGCGAAGIAEKLATGLGWTLWDQRLTQEIARLAHSEKSAVEKREERRDPLYYQLFKSFALGSYEGSPGVPVETLDADGIVRISEGLVEQAATVGNCVIVGRGSQHFLRARGDTLRFFLYALEKKNYDALLPRAKQKPRRECWWIQSTANGLLSSRGTSTLNGRTDPSTTPCSIPRRGTIL